MDNRIDEEGMSIQCIDSNNTGFSIVQYLPLGLPHLR